MGKQSKRIGFRLAEHTLFMVTQIARRNKVVMASQEVKSTTPRGEASISRDKNQVGRKSDSSFYETTEPFGSL